MLGCALHAVDRCLPVSYQRSCPWKGDNPFLSPLPWWELWPCSAPKVVAKRLPHPHQEAEIISKGAALRHNDFWEAGHTPAPCKLSGREGEGGLPMMLEGIIRVPASW